VLFAFVSLGFTRHDGSDGSRKLPLKSTILSVQAAGDLWELSVHEVHNLFQIVFATAQECFADRGFALSASTPSHLSQQGWSDELPTHSGIVKDNSSCRAKESDQSVGVDFIVPRRHFGEPPTD
jgi:hypothetical protein